MRDQILKDLIAHFLRAESGSTPYTAKDTRRLSPHEAVLAFSAAKQAALGLLFVSTTFATNLVSSLSAALLGKATFLAGLVLDGLAATLATAAGLLAAPLALFAGTLAVLAGAFLLLSGGDVENFKYAAEGWKQLMSELTGIEINSFGDAIAASIAGAGDATASIAGAIGSQATLAKNETRLAFQKARSGLESLGTELADLPERGINALSIAKQKISKLPTKAAGLAEAARGRTLDLGTGLQQTKTDLEAVSGVEIDSIGNAVGVVVYQYSGLLSEAAGTALEAVGSSLNLVASQAKLSMAAFFGGSQWESWLSGWQAIGNFVSGAQDRVLSEFQTSWQNWLDGWQLLGSYLADAPSAVFASVSSWWEQWSSGWQAFGFWLSSAPARTQAAVVSWWGNWHQALEFLGGELIFGAIAAKETTIAWIGSWQEGLAAVGDYLTSGTDRIWTLVAGWSDAWVQGLESFSDSVSAGIETVQGWWDGFWGKVWGAIESLAKIIENDIDNLRQSWGIISDSLQGIPGIIKELIDGIKEAIKGFIPNAIAGAGNAMAGFAQPMASFAQPLQQASQTAADTAQSASDSATGKPANPAPAAPAMPAAPTPTTPTGSNADVSASFAGHIPSFAFGMPSTESILSAARFESAKMPAGASLAIANTSEFILTPSQMERLISEISFGSIVQNLGGALTAIAGSKPTGEDGGLSALTIVENIASEASAAKTISTIIPGMERPKIDIGEIMRLIGATPTVAASGVSPPTPGQSQVVGLGKGAIASRQPSPSGAQTTVNNIGPVHIHISSTVSDPEQQAKQVLSYIDSMLKREIDSTL